VIDMEGNNDMTEAAIVERALEEGADRTPVEESRARLADADARLAEISVRLDRLPGLEAELHAQNVRGDLADRAATRQLAKLVEERRELEAEAEQLAGRREALTTLIGERESAERERIAEEALAAGEVVQERIVEAWRLAGERFEGLVAAWGEIVDAETELAGLREQVPDMGRRARLASPSEPLPSDLRSFVARVLDAALDPRRLGRDHPAYGRVGVLMPDLSGYPAGRVWLPGVTPYSVS
jgi:hypothetical protein